MTEIEREWQYMGLDRFEKVPYKKCPNCGEYKFRLVEGKITGLPIIGTTKLRYAETCKNCHYTRKEWEEEA